MTIKLENEDDAIHFDRGKSWHSLDDGKTWQEGPMPESAGSGPGVEIKSVDRERGVITAGPIKARG